MSWLLVFALYSGGHLDTMQQIKFASKEMCVSGAQQISKTFASKADMYKWECVLVRKEK